VDGTVFEFTTQNLRDGFILLLTFLNNFVKFTSLQKDEMNKEDSIINVLPFEFGKYNSSK